MKTSMTIGEYILQVIRVLERMRPGMICYGYLTSNAPRTHFWYHIVLSDVEWYLTDKRFKAYSQIIHKQARERFGQKIIFVAATPMEDKLISLNEEDNLIMNV